MMTIIICQLYIENLAIPINQKGCIFKNDRVFKKFCNQFLAILLGFNYNHIVS